MNAAAALAQEGPIAPRPIVISVGLDGFTCNTKLLTEWLQRINVNFNLAIVTNSLAGLDHSHFWTVDDKTFVATFNSNDLLRSLLDPTRAPENHRELIDLWNNKQGVKDGESAFCARRNVRPKALMDDVQLLVQTQTPFFLCGVCRLFHAERFRNAEVGDVCTYSTDGPNASRVKDRIVYFPAGRHEVPLRDVLDEAELLHRSCNDCRATGWLSPTADAEAELSQLSVEDSMSIPMDPRLLEGNTG